MRAETMQDVMHSDTEIVSALKAALTRKVGVGRFQLWFGSGTELGLRDGALVVGAPNQFFLEWLRASCRKDLEDCCREVLGPGLAVVFELLESTTPHPAGDGTRAAAPTEQNGGPQPENGRPVAEGPSAADSPLETAFAPRNSSAERKRPFARLETFVVGSANRLAHTSATLVAESPGSISPLYLHGPTGVGKTHLLEGIWSAVRQRHKGACTVYVSAEQFTTSFLAALHGSGLPSFRRKYRGVDVLILDDLQFLRGKRATLVELLHTIDTLLRAGKQLVTAADAPPAELSELGPELACRLQGGLTCRLAPPDGETRLGIVRRMAENMRLAVPAAVQEFIAAHFTSHARELSGALYRLQAASQALGKPISLSLAAEALADMVRHAAPLVRLPDIEKAVCQTFGLEASSLQSGRKAKHVSHPRMLAMWLARKYTRAALSEIGQYFGGRSHSTVVSAEKRIRLWMADGASLQLADQRWTVDEAVRAVEERLRITG